MVHQRPCNRELFEDRMNNWLVQKYSIKRTMLTQKCQLSLQLKLNNDIIL